MEHLRDRIADIAELIPRAKPVVYLDYPVHTNIGDLLIEKGTEAFFARLGYEVVDRRSALDVCSRVTRRIPADATLVFHGGGNFGDLYDQHQSFRERVIEQFPRHRIVLLPQTMHFESPDRLKQAAAIFARHPDLHVCLRDIASMDVYRRHFANPSYLVPDMAHFLWDAFVARPPAVLGKGTLRLARRDKESQGLLEDLAGGAAPCDWWDIIGPYEFFAFRVLRKAHALHGLAGGRLPLAYAWRLYIDRLIENAVQLIEVHEAVVTNRLHAAIFALLLERPVTMSDNSYGKLSGYYATWLTDIPNVRLLIAAEGEPLPDASPVLASAAGD